MNDTSASRGPEASRGRPPRRPAVTGALRRELQHLFPDLDPDVVAAVLGLATTDAAEGGTAPQGET